MGWRRNHRNIYSGWPLFAFVRRAVADVAAVSDWNFSRWTNGVEGRRIHNTLAANRIIHNRCVRAVFIAHAIEEKNPPDNPVRTESLIQIDTLPFVGQRPESVFGKCGAAVHGSGFEHRPGAPAPVDTDQPRYTD